MRSIDETSLKKRLPKNLQRNEALTRSTKAFINRVTFRATCDPGSLLLRVVVLSGGALGMPVLLMAFCKPFLPHRFTLSAL
jgi:hypothetical protein